MRAVVQRVASAHVEVAGERVASIGRGLAALVGVAKSDGAKDAEWLAGKLAGLRVFEDAAGKMNLDLSEAGGRLLLVSNFTVCGSAQKGRRPSFDEAASFEDGRSLFEAVVLALRSLGLEPAIGVYGAEMQVTMVNDGPVTLVLESRP